MHKGHNAEDSNVSNGETNAEVFGDEGNIRKENRKIWRDGLIFCWFILKSKRYLTKEFFLLKMRNITHRCHTCLSLLDTYKIHALELKNEMSGE